MTALREYQRLEASGLWRASPQAQRTDVIVSIGDATLVITDTRDRPLTHWSLAAVERANPGELPAIYHPDGDPGETLELAGEEGQMIEAIEKLRTAIGRQRPHPGRLRLMMFAVSMAIVVTLGTFWLPEVLRNHAVSVVPSVKRAEIGEALMARIQKVTGPPCTDPSGTEALARLASRLGLSAGAGKLNIMREGVGGAVLLPGGSILINRDLVEDYEEPDVLAGYIIAERIRAQMDDPLGEILARGGMFESVRLLTTGSLSPDMLQSYAEWLLTAPRPDVDTETLLGGFRTLSVRSSPYAYAVDITGETTLGLIEADPFKTETPAAVLTDADWLRLQGICGG